MMMVLGLYVFILAHRAVSRSCGISAAGDMRLTAGLTDARQRSFWDRITIMLTLSGVLMPEITGGRLSLLALEQMAEQGKAWPLIEGSDI